MRAVLPLVALSLMLTGAATGRPSASAQPPASAEPVVTTLPVLLEAPDVEYPDDEKAEGVVVLRVFIDERGRVGRVEVVDGVSPAIDRAALGAATRFRFSPAETKDGPVAAIIDYQLSFSRGEQHASGSDTDPTTTASSGDEKPATLRGRLRVAGGARPLAQAEVAVVHLSTDEVTLSFSDDEGRFLLEGLAPGRYRVEVSAFGYEPVIVEQSLASGEDVGLRIAVRTDVGDPFETVVRASRSRAAVSRVTLTRDEVEAIPGTFGDALRVVESLPGAARTPFFGGGLVLRGGMPGDSRIFFDGVEIPVLFHWGGLASIVNPAFLEELSYYPSGFPVEYGRATAGVVDVKSHALDLDGFVGSVDVDVADTGFFFAGPVRVGQLPKLSFGFAARRSYLEGFGALMLAAAPVVGAPVPFLPVPRYWDFQAKVQTKPLPGHSLALTAFGSDDRISLLGEPVELGDITGDLTLEELLNNVVANELFRVILEHEWRLAPGVTHVLRPWVGTTRRGALADNVVVDLFTGSAFSTPDRQQNWGVRDELRVSLAPWLRVIGGAEHVGKAFAFGLGPPFVDPEAESECPPGAVSCLEAYLAEGTQTSTAVYSRLELGPLGGLSVYPGVRVEHFGLVYEDRYGNLAEGQTVAQDLLSVDPRIAARYQLTRDFAFKATLGSYQMPPSIEESVLDNDGRALLAERGLHAVAGFEHAFTPSLSLDAQVYGVRRDQLVRDGSKLYSEDTGRAPLAILDVPGPFDSFGRGQTVGFELMLRHQPSRYFFGWVAYTFSHTWLDVGRERYRRHPSPFDQTHNLTLVGRVNLPWEITLGGRFQYATGNPGPLPGNIAVVHDLGSGSYAPLEDPGERPRLPAFHRLDVRLDKKITFNDFTLGAYVEVVNVYNKLNPEVIMPGGDFRSRGTLTVLPSVPFLPTVGFSGAF